jgi:hypothetical protein
LTPGSGPLDGSRPEAKLKYAFTGGFIWIVHVRGLVPVGMDPFILISLMPDTGMIYYIFKTLRS